MSIFNKPPPGKIRHYAFIPGIEFDPLLWSIQYKNLKEEEQYKDMEKAWSISFLFFVFIYYQHPEDEDTNITYDL